MGYPSRLDDPELMRTIIAEYQAGAGLHVLACQHKVGWHTLRRRLVDAGVTLHPQGGARPPRPPGDIAPYTGRKYLSDEQVAALRAAIGFDESWR